MPDIHSFIYLQQHLLTRGVLVPPPGTEPVPLQWNLNHWIAREVPLTLVVCFLKGKVTHYKVTVVFSWLRSRGN